MPELPVTLYYFRPESFRKYVMRDQTPEEIAAWRRKQWLLGADVREYDRGTLKKVVEPWEAQFMRGDITGTRAAASSIARGKPSRTLTS